MSKSLDELIYKINHAVRNMYQLNFIEKIRWSDFFLIMFIDWVLHVIKWK